MHLVLFKNRSCSSRTSCLEQATEQQQFNPGENRKSCSATIYVPHSNSGRATTEHQVAKRVEQHPQCFLLQKAPTRLGSLRLLRMNETLFVGGWLQSILQSNYSSASQQPCKVGIFLAALRLTKVAETKARSGRTGDPRVLTARQPAQTLFHSRKCPVEQSGEGCWYHDICSLL